MAMTNEEVKVESELVDRIAKALQRTAAKRSLLTYQRFHEICGPTVRLARRYEALEQALQSLSDIRTFDYGVLLALDSGLPADDYFKRFMKFRYQEYVARMGDPRVQRQSIKRKWELVQCERERTYRHTESNHCPQLEVSA